MNAQIKVITHHLKDSFSFMSTSQRAMHRAINKAPWMGPTIFTPISSPPMYLSGTQAQDSTTQDTPSKMEVSRSRPISVASIGLGGIVTDKLQPAMSDYRIHQLSGHEWQRAKAIRLRALSSAPTAFCSKLSEEQALTDQQWQARQSKKNIATFIAELCSNREDIGMVVAGPYDRNAGLYSLWIDRRYRRLGVGSALVDAVIEWAKENNYRRLLLDVGKENQPALKLYQSKQFSPTGRTQQLDFGHGPIDECQLVLNLNKIY